MDQLVGPAVLECGPFLSAPAPSRDTQTNSNVGPGLDQSASTTDCLSQRLPEFVARLGWLVQGQSDPEDFPGFSVKQLR